MSAFRGGLSGGGGGGAVRGAQTICRNRVSDNPRKITHLDSHESNQQKPGQRLSHLLQQLKLALLALHNMELLSKCHDSEQPVPCCWSLEVNEQNLHSLHQKPQTCGVCPAGPGWGSGGPGGCW